MVLSPIEVPLVDVRIVLVSALVDIKHFGAASIDEILISPRRKLLDPELLPRLVGVRHPMERDSIPTIFFPHS